MLAGLIVPDVGAFLLLLIPPQNVVPETTIRLLMLAGVLIVPGLVGVLTLALTTGAQRTARGTVEAVAPRLPADRPAGRPAHLPRRPRDLAQGHQPGQALDRRPRPDGRQRRRVPGGRGRPRPGADRGRPRARAGGSAGHDVAAREMARVGRRGVVRRAGPGSDDPAARHRPRHPDLPDGRADLGQTRRGHPRAGGDRQPADDLGCPPDGQRRGAGGRRSAHPPRPRIGRRAGPTAAVRRRCAGRVRRDRRDAWPRSASRTRNGRSCTASASRSSATCAPGRWPARPSSARSNPTATASPRWPRSAGSCARVPRRSSMRRRTSRRSRPSTSWPARAGGWRRRRPTSRLSPPARPSAGRPNPRRRPTLSEPSAAAGEPVARPDPHGD